MRRFCLQIQGERPQTTCHTPITSVIKVYERGENLMCAPGSTAALRALLSY